MDFELIFKTLGVSGNENIAYLAGFVGLVIVLIVSALSIDMKRWQKVACSIASLGLMVLLLWNWKARFDSDVPVAQRQIEESARKAAIEVVPWTPGGVSESGIVESLTTETNPLNGAYVIKFTIRGEDFVYRRVVSVMDSEATMSQDLLFLRLTAHRDDHTAVVVGYEWKDEKKLRRILSITTTDGQSVWTAPVKK